MKNDEVVTIFEDVITIFEDGEWALRRYSTRAWVSHYCGYNNDKLWHYRRVIDSNCYMCEKQPPDKILGLCELYNWSVEEN